MAYQLKVDFSDEYFRKLGLKEGYDKVLADTLLLSSVQAEGLIRKEAPNKTGNLRRSTQHYTKGSKEAGVAARGAPYWWHVEYGTAPHVITPKKSKALRFQIGKDEVYAKKVQHPGTAPNPFVKRAVNTLRSRKMVQQAFRASLQKHGIQLG